MKNIIQSRSYRNLFWHFAIWLIVFLLPFIFRSEHSNYPNKFIYLDTITKLFWMSLFYINTELLINKFIYKKKIFIFIVSQLVLFGIIMLLHGILFGYLVKSKHFNLMYSSLYNSIPFLFTITVSIVYRYLKDNLKENAILKEKQAENLKTELSFLRSQISPHFLFNVLNNIVALVRIKSDELEPSIMKLSSILQYMLYETDEENVSLSNEIEYLRSYIDLQKQRFGIKLSTQITFTIEENWHRIEPMLLIPFIENAFKHGFSNIQNPEINIELTVKNNVLEFSVKNKFNANSEEVKDKTSGIGLANVKRRLELLYGEKQQLYISKQDDWFTVLLKLNLQS